MNKVNSAAKLLSVLANERLFQVIDVLRQHPEGITVTHISEILEKERALIHEHIKKLEGLGLTMRMGKQGREVPHVLNERILIKYLELSEELLKVFPEHDIYVRPGSRKKQI